MKRDVAAAVALALALCAGAATAQDILPRPDPTFTGTLARTLQGSKPEFPPPLRPPAGAPNVLVVLIDDAGFGNPATFGGPVATPTLDGLAARGLRYNRFHVTALCSPTRAALLSGRNHHAMPIFNRAFSIDADIDVESNRCVLGSCSGAEGVIVANASFLGGFSLYVRGGKLRYTYSFLGLELDDLVTGETLSTGKLTVRYEFTADKPNELATGGTQRLFVGGKQVAEGKLEHTVPLRFSGSAGMDVGRDNGLPVSPNRLYYLRRPFPFEGTIERVTFDLT